MICVIVCTHNPRPEVWSQSLAALHAQSLPPDQWDLVVIDNASRPGAVSPGVIDWHPHGRVIVEPTLGLTAARLRGIAETGSDLLVFVDDDNVLAPDYLATALTLAATHLHVGAFGGNVTGKFETPPPDWAADYLVHLALRHVERASWSNVAFDNPTCPCGAGLVIRRAVAEGYAKMLAHDPTRRALDRVGSNLDSCGDTDLALTACDIGLSTGMFPELRVTHLIPAERVQLDYLCALTRGIRRSIVVLAAVRGRRHPPIRRGRLERLLKAYQRLRIGRERRLLDEADEAGWNEGVEFVARMDA